MTRVVLFDLGGTLEVDGELRAGAAEMLLAVSQARDAEGRPVVLTLLSDFDAADGPAQALELRRRYLEIIDGLGIRSFFEPVEARVTLSTELGVWKPDPLLFRRALDKVETGLHFHAAVFITERADHVDAARELGMYAIHLRAPSQLRGDVDRIEDLAPVLERLLRFEPCGKRAGRAKGRHMSQAGRSKAREAAIVELVSQVDEAGLLKSVEELAGFTTRWSHSPQLEAVTEWLRARFSSAGYGAEQCRFQPFTLPGAGPQRNVLASKSGDAGAGIILLCAHYDSISERPRDAAPGADDDASGVAATLEIARLLAPLPLKRQVLFALFGGEEQGLFGSGECADVAVREGWPIDVVINLDMIGFNSRTPPRVVVEYDQGNRNPGNDAAAKAFGLLMAQAAADYTALEVEHTDIWNSDYMPFEAKGFACIGAYEGGENPHYHTTSDVSGNVDGAYLKAVTQMVLATVLQLAR